MKRIKQYLSEKQWKELSEKQQRTLLNAVIGKNIGVNYAWIVINIGAMIEYLGDDLEYIWKDEKDWVVEIKYYAKAKQTEFYGKELRTSLWKACKNKLNI